MFVGLFHLSPHLSDPTVQAGWIRGLGKRRVDRRNVLALGHQQPGQMFGKVPALRVLANIRPNSSMVSSTPDLCIDGDMKDLLRFFVPSLAADPDTCELNPGAPGLVPPPASQK